MPDREMPETGVIVAAGPDAAREDETSVSRKRRAPVKKR
jgi:hypothetical protein